MADDAAIHKETLARFDGKKAEICARYDQEVADLDQRQSDEYDDLGRRHAAMLRLPSQPMKRPALEWVMEQLEICTAERQEVCSRQMEERDVLHRRREDEIASLVLRCSAEFGAAGVPAAWIIEWRERCARQAGERNGLHLGQQNELFHMLQRHGQEVIEDSMQDGNRLRTKGKLSDYEVVGNAALDALAGARHGERKRIKKDIEDRFGKGETYVKNAMRYAKRLRAK